MNLRRAVTKSLARWGQRQWKFFASFTTRQKRIWSSRVAAISRRSFTVFSERPANVSACRTDEAIQTAWCCTMPGIQPLRISWKVTLAQKRYRSGWAGPTRLSFSTTHTPPSNPGNKPGNRWKGLPVGRRREWMVVNRTPQPGRFDGLARSSR